MLREYQQLIDRIQIAINGLIVALAYAACCGRVASEGSFSDCLNAIVLISLLVMMALSARKFSLSSRIISPSTIFKHLFISDGAAVATYIFISYMLKLPNPGRLYLLGGIGAGLLLQIAYDLPIYWLYRRVRSLGYNYRNVLLIGNQYTLPPVVEMLRSNPSWGLNICGAVTLSENDRRGLSSVRYLGTIKNMERILDSRVVDYVIVTVYRQAPQLCEDALLLCYERGIEIWLKPDFMHQRVAISRVDYMETVPLIVFSQGPKYGLAVLAKRALDVFGALALLAVLAAPMLAVALLILLMDGGPVFFSQMRVGMHGRRFRIYKFKTMDARAGGPPLKLKNEMSGPIFKMENDPRVTLLGRLLRKYSLDELPQLWNVLAGDMSLIGPRPPTPDEVDLYRGWHRRRLSMRPGITGLWQVSGRNDIKRFEDRARLDLKYIDTWSLWLDFKILFWTIPQVLEGTGS